MYVKYSATLNENAVVGLPGNENKSTLKYGDSTNTKSTPNSKTITYTWDMDILKYGDGDENKVLENAKFVLLNKDATKAATIVDGKSTGWVAIPGASADGAIAWPANTILTTDKDGKIHIDGLDADTYYLREIKAPAGYNELNTDVKVTIDHEGKITVDDSADKTDLVKVNNNSGTELPSTGGTGTTVFYVLGSILVIGAGVLLVTKKRMNDRA